MDATTKSCYKNLAILSCGWFLFCMSFISLRNVVSSVNHENGIGLYSLACTYASYMLTTCFTSGIVKGLGAKGAIICALVFQVIFVLSNIKQHVYIILPASCLGGASQAVMWTAVSMYIMDLVIRTERLDINRNVKGKFFGIFFTFAALAPVFGALLTAVVLTPTNTEHPVNLISNGNDSQSNNFNYSTNNIHLDDLETEHGCSFQNIVEQRDINNINCTTGSSHQYPICGPNFCHSYFEKKESKAISEYTRALLFGLYGLCMFFALLLFILFLDSDRTSTNSKCPFTCTGHYCSKFIANVQSTFKLITTKSFILIIPIIFFHGMQTAFFSGEVTKAFPGCLYGFDYIGYFVMCFGISAALTSFLSGCASGVVDRSFFLVMAMSVDIFALTGMYLWDEQSNDVLFVFALAALWGIGEGIWTTHLNSLVGATFPYEPEEAYSAFNLILALGLTVGYTYSHYVCMFTKIIVTGVLSITGILSYQVSLWVQKRGPRRGEMEEVRIEVTSQNPENTDLLDTNVDADSGVHSEESVFLNSNVNDNAANKDTEESKTKSGSIDT